MKHYSLAALAQITKLADTTRVRDAIETNTFRMGEGTVWWTVPNPEWGKRHAAQLYDSNNAEHAKILVDSRFSSWSEYFQYPHANGQIGYHPAPGMPHNKGVVPIVIKPVKISLFATSKMGGAKEHRIATMLCDGLNFETEVRLVKKYGYSEADICYLLSKVIPGMYEAHFDPLGRPAPVDLTSSIQRFVVRRKLKEKLLDKLKFSPLVATPYGMTPVSRRGRYNVTKRSMNLIQAKCVTGEQAGQVIANAHNVAADLPDGSLLLFHATDEQIETLVTYAVDDLMCTQ